MNKLENFNEILGTYYQQWGEASLDDLLKFEAIRRITGITAEQDEAVMLSAQKMQEMALQITNLTRQNDSLAKSRDYWMGHTERALQERDTARKERNGWHGK